MIRTLLAALLVTLAAGSAQADVWTRAIAGEKTIDKYDELLAQGDVLALSVDATGITAKIVAASVDRSIAAYTDAAKLRPLEGEPYFRIASVLESYFTDCPSPLQSYGSQRRRPPTCPVNHRKIDVARASQAIAAWDAFERLAPLDPRVREVLFNRAVLRTKLVDGAKDPAPLLEGAVTDYLAILHGSDDLAWQFSEPSVVWGNLAESYMMLGQLEKAVDAFRVAINRGAYDSSTAYGLAVALDREGSPAEALEVIRSQGVEAVLTYRQRYQQGSIFYVPSGEEHYYLALVYEAFDRTNESIAEWNAFIRSGAHPRYQPRAKAHLDALIAKQKTARPTQPRRFDPFELD